MECDHKTIDHTSSSDSKMVIKLKIPNQTPEINDDVIGILNSKTFNNSKKICEEVKKKKICLECKKEFSSGKALGGHMRIHLNNKNPNFLKHLKANNNNNGSNGDDQYVTKPYYMNSVNHEGKPTCSQCGKTFPSMKSLFGHMRCHPERVWRGILPPPHTLSSTSTAVVTTDRTFGTDDSGDQVVDLTRFLPRWPVTERRGRKAVKQDEDDDVVLLEAVEDLMSLANAGGFVVTEPPAKLEVDDMDMNNEQVLINCKLKMIKKPKRMKPMMEMNPNDVVIVDNSELQPLPELQQTVTECNSNNNNKYKCTSCNKCFATHQALGGHSSSHNKPRLTSPNCYLIEDHDHKAFVMNVPGENMEREGVHQCKICNKVFTTGQALGGHQRCHWSGITAGPGSSSQITSSGDGGSHTGDRKVLDFDLNEIPVVVIEEDEGGNGYGYASSSYNSNIF